MINKVHFHDIFIDNTKYALKIPKEEYLSSGIVPVIDQGQNYIGGYSNDAELYTNIPCIIFGDHTRVIKYVDFNFTIGADGVKLLNVTNPKFLPKYLYYHLLYSKIPNTGYNRHFKFLKELLFYEYPLSNQQKIVEELDCLNDIIDKKKQQLADLDNLIKSQFIEMFGEENNTDKLVNLCQFINGDRGKNYPSSSDRIDKGVPFINAGHLNNNYVCFDEMDYISEEKYKTLSSGKLQKEDIIYCLRGSLGKKGIVTFDRGAIASSLLILRPNERIRPLFLLYSLEQEYIMSQMKTANNGSSQPNLSAQSVKQYDVILPTLKKQIKFEKFVEYINKLKCDIQKSIEETQMLLNSRMQHYFGE